MVSIPLNKNNSLHNKQHNVNNNNNNNNNRQQQTCRPTNLQPPPIKGAQDQDHVEEPVPEEGFGGHWAGMF